MMDDDQYRLDDRGSAQQEMAEWFLSHYVPCHDANEDFEDFLCEAMDALTSEFGNSHNQTVIRETAEFLDNRAGTTVWQRISDEEFSLSSCRRISKSKLCETFQKLSSRTWRDLRDGQDIKLSEETLTDINLLCIMRRHANEVRILKFSRADEGKRTGADWEWWFVKANDVFRLRVQAKRIEFRNNNYPGLHKNAPNGTKQVDLLIGDAIRNNLYPMYCFYNYWKSGPNHWQCSGRPPRRELLGCTIADATKVKRFIDNNTITAGSISNIWHPLHCIVCCDESSMSLSLPHRARNFVRDSLGGENVPEVSSLPSYATLLEGGEISLNEGIVSSFIERNIGGIMILRGFD